MGSIFEFQIWYIFYVSGMFYMMAMLYLFYQTIWIYSIGQQEVSNNSTAPSQSKAMLPNMDLNMEGFFFYQSRLWSFYSSNSQLQQNTAYGVSIINV